MYRLDGLRIYQGDKLMATAANPEAARRLLNSLNNDAAYAERVLRSMK